MPSPSRPVRRCAFKLPKNDKYQCQKAGDKYQLRLGLWYCRLHDRHAQDRCQVLVEWAGKGAQCEKLGQLIGETGQRLCDLHVIRKDEDVQLQVQYQSPRQREIRARGDDAKVNIQHAKTDHEVNFEELEETTTLHLVPSPEQIHYITSPTSTILEETPASQTNDASFTQQEEEQTLRIRASIPSTVGSKNDVSLNQTPLDAVESPTSPFRQTNDPPPASSTSIQAPAALQLAPTAALHPETTWSPTTPSGPDTPPNPKLAHHKRIDSLLSNDVPIASAATPSSNTPSHPTLQPTIPSLTTSPTSSFHPSPHTRIAFLTALQSHASSSSTCTTAHYVQCCVCLEKHGEYNMRVVEGCGHRYRELCLRKAVKGRTLRRFRCKGCKGWMEGWTEGVGEG